MIVVYFFVKGLMDRFENTIGVVKDSLEGVDEHVEDSAEIVKDLIEVLKESGLGKLFKTHKRKLKT